MICDVGASSARDLLRARMPSVSAQLQGGGGYIGITARPVPVLIDGRGSRSAFGIRRAGIVGAHLQIYATRAPRE